MSKVDPCIYHRLKSNEMCTLICVCAQVDQWIRAFTAFLQNSKKN